jgi:hypothetical protein
MTPTNLKRLYAFSYLIEAGSKSIASVLSAAQKFIALIVESGKSSG